MVPCVPLKSFQQNNPTNPCGTPQEIQNPIVHITTSTLNFKKLLHLLNDSHVNPKQRVVKSTRMHVYTHKIVGKQEQYRSQ